MGFDEVLGGTMVRDVRNNSTISIKYRDIESAENFLRHLEMTGVVNIGQSQIESVTIRETTTTVLRRPSAAFRRHQMENEPYPNL